MKKLLITFLLLGSFELLSAQNDTQLILKEIKVLRADMNKRFEQVDKRFEQVDKRFEQVNKRFEQVDKRFEFMKSLLFVLLGLVLISPFIAIYLRDKRDAQDRKNFSNLDKIIFVLREMAQDNEKIAKTLKSASLI
jgi:tetrahydromethanopterin S-methyltransferase subunit G